jgi:UDP-N-acetylglucosamine transferase subunit ALG13
MIFLTVGTQFPFDRLVRAVDSVLDEGLIDEEVFAQIGETSYKPHNFESVVSLEKRLFDKRLKEASAMIGHAGMGTITLALENDKPLLVMPRLKKYREVVNDHQLAIARKFEAYGHVLVAYHEKDLPDKAGQLRHFVPTKRRTQVQDVARRISAFLDGLCESGQSLPGKGNC